MGFNLKKAVSKVKKVTAPKNIGKSVKEVAKSAINPYVAGGKAVLDGVRQGDIKKVAQGAASTATAMVGGGAANAATKMLTGKNIGDHTARAGMGSLPGYSSSKGTRADQAKDIAARTPPPPLATNPPPIAGQNPGNNPYNHWNIPRPERIKTVDDKGNILDNFKLDYMKERAESPWAKLQQNKLTQQYDANRSNIMGEAMTGANSGFNSMARQGGVTGGGRAALFSAANRDALKQQQALGLGYQGQMKDVLTEDIDRQLKVDQRNFDTSLGQIDATFKPQMDAYDALLKKQASDYMADSIRAQAGGAGAAGGAGGGGIIEEGKRLIPGATTGGASEWNRLKQGDKWAAARTVGTLGANVVHDQAARALGIPAF